MKVVPSSYPTCLLWLDFCRPGHYTHALKHSRTKCWTTRDHTYSLEPTGIIQLLSPLTHSASWATLALPCVALHGVLRLLFRGIYEYKNFSSRCILPYLIKTNLRFHLHPWLIHVSVWQKLLQYCKVISLQLIKINEKKKKRSPVLTLWFPVPFVFALLAGFSQSLSEEQKIDLKRWSFKPSQMFWKVSFACCLSIRTLSIFIIVYFWILSLIIPASLPALILSLSFQCFPCNFINSQSWWLGKGTPVLGPVVTWWWGVGGGKSSLAPWAGLCLSESLCLLTVYFTGVSQLFVSYFR